ncbi:hypothetical protein RUM44_013990 [Polyplax serrata]|uniref:Large ribosomal subunit protein bL17m n=1 Tax=Polyplax serrata TaxID=468196 RepID=A0ABR1BJS3_POLSC
MSQAEASRLVSKLRYNLKDRRKLSNIKGPQGRHDKIRKTVTALLKYERIELNYNSADESRGYAERLISDAIKFGDCHKETMKMASYWVIEKPIVHKLFKVLAPRYQNFPLSYTKMWRAPLNPKDGKPKCVLELRNNIYPPLGPDTSNHKNLLHNVLLSEAKKAYDKEKALVKLQEVNENLKLRAEARIKDNMNDKESNLITESMKHMNLGCLKEEQYTELSGDSNQSEKVQLLQEEENVDAESSTEKCQELIKKIDK